MFLEKFQVVSQMVFRHAVEDAAAPDASANGVLPLASNHFVERSGNERHRAGIARHDLAGQISVGIAFAAEGGPGFGDFALVFELDEFVQLCFSDVQRCHVICLPIGFDSCSSIWQPDRRDQPFGIPAVLHSVCLPSKRHTSDDRKRSALRP